MITVSQCYLYPLKAAQGRKVDRLQLSLRGIVGDHCWMLVQDSAENTKKPLLPQTANFEKLISVKTLSQDGETCFKTPGPAPLIIKDISLQNRIEISILKETYSVIDAGTQAAQWFTSLLNTPCRLVKMPDDFKRHPPEQYARRSDQISFVDEMPISLATLPSLVELHKHMPPSLNIPITRFRPNIILDGNSAFEEDIMYEIKIGDHVVLDIVKPIAHDKMVTRDQFSGKISSPQPLKVLREQRLGQSLDLSGAFFGQHALPRKFGYINVGDPVKVLSTKPLHPALKRILLKTKAAP